MIKLIKDENKRFKDGQLEYRSVSGWHKDFIKCNKVIGDYRLYINHFNCALPYSVYYVVNTKTCDVLRSGEYHWSIKEELINQIKEEIKKEGK